MGYCIVLDTETTSLDKPFCYDIGYTIINDNGENLIAKHYVVGAQAEAYQTWLTNHNELNLDFGIYLRVNPNFLIKKW